MQLCGDSVVQGLDGRCVVAGGCRVHRQVRYLRVGRQLPCGDARTVSYLSVVQDLRDIAGDRSFKHVYICFRRRLSPVAKASAKELSASYSARGSIPAVSAVSPNSAASVLEPALGPHQARTRPAPGPHQARVFFSEVAWLQCDSI